MARPSVVTDKDFEKEVLGSDMPVLVDFWSSWCPPCKMMEPVLDDLAEEYSGRVKVCKMNVDQNPKTASRYDVLGMPTFVIFHKGGESVRRTGAQSKGQLADMIKNSEACKMDIKI